MHDGDIPKVASDDALLFFILENEPNLVFVKNEAGEIVWANRAFKAIYAPDERDKLIGRTTVESSARKKRTFSGPKIAVPCAKGARKLSRIWSTSEAAR